MNPMLKVSAAVLIAAMSVAPATTVFAAAPDSATVVMGSKTDIVPFATLKPMIGQWSAAQIGALDAATSVKIFDTKSLYSPADQAMVASATTSSASQLKALHTAIDNDAGLKAWFAKNKVDVNRVIGLENNGGALSVYLY